jgi:hypothetical protein
MSGDSAKPDKEFSISVEMPFVQTAPPASKDRRADKRYRCAPAAMVSVRLTESTKTAQGWACNLGASGIGLNLPYPLNVGTDLVLRLQGPCTMVMMAAKVVHATEENAGEWRIGCQFDQFLDLDTLDALLS